MKKIMNAPENFVNEMLEGIYYAYPNTLRSVDGDLRAMVKKDIKPGKVTLATGGGSGHLPLFLGYIGDGMLDGCSVGDIFQSSGAEQMHAVTKAIDTGAGVLYIYGNYNGDRFNFEMSAEMAGFEDDITVEHVIGKDDISSEDPNLRRGVAGIFFLYKCAGAAAEAMLPLAEVKRIAEKAAANVRTMGVALSPCIVPRVGHATFEIGDDEMEIGMGIHGEPGVRRGKLESADKIVDEMVGALLKDMPVESGSEVAVLVNGLGSTPLEEQYIVNRRIHQILTEKGIKVYHTYVGEFATSLEMAGFSISLCKLDDELKLYLSKPAYTPFFKQGQL